MSNFHIGMKVVCINDKPEGGHGDMDGLTEGQIYTIRWMGENTHPECGTEYCIRVEEIWRGMCPKHRMFDVPYRADRFRPVRTTSIDVFTAMLAPTPRI